MSLGTGHGAGKKGAWRPQSSTVCQETRPAVVRLLSDKMSVPGKPLPAEPSGRSRAPRIVDWEML